MQPVAAVRHRRRLEFLKTQMARLRPGPTSSGLALIATDTVCRPMRAVDAAAAKVPRLRLAIVNRSDTIKGFVVLPRRWAAVRQKYRPIEDLRPCVMRSAQSIAWGPGDHRQLTGLPRSSGQ